MYATKERIALKDMLIAKEAGYKVYLSTPMESYLAKVAISNGIECFNIPEHFINRFTDYHKHYPLKRKIKRYKIDIVHCYDFTFLFSLASQLRRFNLISLVITNDHTIDRPLQKFWYRPLLSRIDFLILLNKHLKNDLAGNLNLPMKKIEYFGMGINNHVTIPDEILDLQFSAYKDYFLAGVHFSPDISSISEIEHVFWALKTINASREGDIPLKLCLISNIEFKNSKVLKELTLFLEKESLQEHIIFVTAPEFDSVMKKLNLWISVTMKEFIEDYTLLALVNEIPVIVPRNFCSTELLRDYEGIGESYKAHDSRELRDKWTKVLKARSLYKDKVRLFKFFIEKEHDYKIYRQDLLDLYAKMSLRRARVFKK